MLNHDAELGYCIRIHTLGYLWQDWDLDLFPHVQSWFILFHNSSLIIFHPVNYVCRLSVVSLVPSDWPTDQSLAREYRYRHALLYGSTCWLVITLKFNQPNFRMKTLSSVHGICWRFLSNVLVAMGVSSGLCLKEMMHTIKLRLWLAALPCPSYLGDPTRWRYCYASTNFVLGSALSSTASTLVFDWLRKYF